MFVHELLARAAALTPAEIVCDAMPMEDGDVDHGEMPEEIKRLWVVLDQICKTQDQRTEELMRRHPIGALDNLSLEELSELGKVAARMQAERKIAHTLFWSELMLAFPDASLGEKTGDGIAVCEGWRVVARTTTSRIESMLITALLGRAMRTGDSDQEASN